MSSCGAYYHEFSESSSACLLKGKCPFSLTNAIELLLKASAEWLWLGAPRLRVTHEHYCCAATFQATPVLRELANTSKPKHGLIPIRCCFNVIALKHRSSVCLGGLKINRSIEPAIINSPTASSDGPYTQLDTGSNSFTPLNRSVRSCSQPQRRDRRGQVPRLRNS